MDRYTRKEKPRPTSAINENEIRITSQGLVRNYITYATTLLQEKHAKDIVLKAMGQAISKAVSVVEIIKKRYPELHQDTSISSISITDVWEPIEEGLIPLEMTRHVSMIAITLSTREPNKKSLGYQAPLHLEKPKQQQITQQPQHFQQAKQERYRQPQDSYVRGRGRGRGRGNGWARGGYGGYDYNQGGYGRYGNSQGGYGNNQGGYGNNQGGYSSYGNNQGHYGGYGYNQGGYGGYGYEQENGGWNSNWGRGGGRSRGNWNYRGYDDGRGGGGGRFGGRGFSRGRGRISGRGRGNQF